MKKALRLLLALSLVGALFAAGFAGTAAATDKHDKKHKWWKKHEVNQKQASWQYANSDVDQKQYVKQSNYNKQGYAVAAAYKGDAEAEQENNQANVNAQYADSDAQNYNKQYQKA